VLDEAYHRRGRELATVVSDLDRRCVIEVLDGCTRRMIERWLRALPAEVRVGIEIISIDPLQGLPPGDPSGAAARPDRVRPPFT